MKNAYIIVSISLIAVPLLVSIPEQSFGNSYHAELEAAFQTPTSNLARTSMLNSGSALAVLRVAQWCNHLAQTQQRIPYLKDKIGYFFMENEISPFADRCYALLPSDVPQLSATVAKYSRILGIPTPFVILVDDRKLLDATAAAWTHASGFLVLSRGLFEQTTDQEFCGIVAHELGHIVQRYQAKMTLLFAPVAILGFIGMLYCMKKMLINTTHFSWWQMAGALALIGGYGMIAVLYWCALSRKYEQLADISAAQISPENGLAMIGALQRGQQDIMGGDLSVAKSIIEDMGALTAEERFKLEVSISKMQTECTEALDAGRYELGAFGTHRPLAERKQFFESIIAQEKQGQR